MTRVNLLRMEKRMFAMQMLLIIMILILCGLNYSLYNKLARCSPVRSNKKVNWYQPTLVFSSPQAFHSHSAYRDVAHMLGYKHGISRINPHHKPKPINAETPRIANEVNREGENSRKVVSDTIPDFDNYIRYKASLVSRGGKYIPKAFHLPKQKQEFINYASTNKKHWIQKSPIHRGNLVKEVEKLDLHRESLIQEYVSNPFLIDSRKFSLGIHIFITSANPLRMYIMESDVRVRLAEKGYYPEDFTDINTYITDGYDVVNVKETEEVYPLKYYRRIGYSHKQSLDSFIALVGENPSEMYSKIYDAVRDVLNRSSSLFKPMDDPNTNYYINSRWDFILDEDFKLFLLETNLIPGLIKRHGNHFGYHVIYNLFRLCGLADLNSFQDNPALYKVRDSDIQIEDQVCYTSTCSSCSHKACHLCLQCLSENQKSLLKRVFTEHLNRGTMRLVFPVAKNTEDNGYNSRKNWQMDHNNDLTAEWLRAKCSKDVYWCSNF